MGLELKKVSVEEAAVHLGRKSLCGPKGKPEECPEGFYVDECQKGGMTPAGFFFDGRHIASVALQSCQGQLGKELVINALAGDLDDLGFLSEGLSLIEAYAHQTGYAQIRFHTFRMGLVEMAKQNGFYPSEMIMKKVLV